MTEDINNLLKRWRSGIKVLEKNIEESKSKGLPFETMKGYRDGLAEASHDLEFLLKNAKCGEKESVTLKQNKEFSGYVFSGYAFGNTIRWAYKTIKDFLKH